MHAQRDFVLSLWAWLQLSLSLCVRLCLFVCANLSFFLCAHFLAAQRHTRTWLLTWLHACALTWLLTRFSAAALNDTWPACIRLALIFSCSVARSCMRFFFIAACSARSFARFASPVDKTHTHTYTHTYTHESHVHMYYGVCLCLCVCLCLDLIVDRVAVSRSTAHANTHVSTCTDLSLRDKSLSEERDGNVMQERRYGAY
jgi:hypothetical protein